MSNDIVFRLQEEIKRLNHMVDIGSAMSGIKLRNLQVDKIPPGAVIKGVVNQTVENLKAENAKTRQAVVDKMNDVTAANRKAEALRNQIKSLGAKPVC